MRERRFPAMGTTVHLLVDGPEVLLDLGQSKVLEAERRWSRFIPDSELCQLNNHAGQPVLVSDETFALVASALDAWQATNGLFDPTVHDALRSLGYDRDFGDLPTNLVDEQPRSGPVPTPAEIEMHHAASIIEIPHGVSLDLGGIAKGATADLVAEALRLNGASACCVNIGGDLRLSGPGPIDGSWEIGFSFDHEIPKLGLSTGAVCTSSTQKRWWRRSDRVVHHLIDPRTGESFDSEIVAATVLANTAMGAEILAKLPIALGPIKGADVLRNHGATGLLFDRHGDVHQLDGLAPFLCAPIIGDSVVSAPVVSEPVVGQPVVGDRAGAA